MKIKLLVVALALCVLPVAAQTPVPSPTPPTTTLWWDHDGVNTSGYALTVDGVRAVVDATCSVREGVRQCIIPFPALTPGNHVLIVSAFNDAGEALSDPFPVIVFVQPAKPTNIKIGK